MEQILQIILYALAGFLFLFFLIFGLSKKKRIMDKSKFVFAIPFLLISLLVVGFTLMQSGALVSLGVSPLAVSGSGVTDDGVTDDGSINTDTDTSGKICLFDGMTATVSGTNKYTSLATGGTHEYFKNGQAGKTVSDGGTISVSCGDVVQVLYGNETDSTYYGELKTFNIGYDNKYPSLSAEMVANGTLTMDAFNTEGNLIDGGANNQTIGADTTKNVRVRLQGPSKQGFPHGGVLVLELNGTEYDESNSELTVSSGSVSLSSADVPAIHTITATDRKVKAWNVGAIEGTNEINLNLYLDSDSTYNPTDLNDPVLYFYPNDYFVNEDKGGIVEGPSVNDEKNVQNFLYQPSVTISVN